MKNTFHAFTGRVPDRLGSHADAVPNRITLTFSSLHNYEPFCDFKTCSASSGSVSHSSLLLAGPKVLFFLFSSLFTLFGLVCQFFFQLIVRSSFCLYIKNTKCSQLLYPPGLESLVKEYNNECTLKSSDDASALRWTYRCLRYQR